MEVHPKDDAHGKGYKLSQFDEAFARYLSDAPQKSPSDPRIRASRP
jgi:hypothetical protein